LPETKQNLATYSQRCEVLLSKGHSALKSTLPPILWPTVVSPATASSQGWLCYFCSFFISFVAGLFLSLGFFR